MDTSSVFTPPSEEKEKGRAMNTTESLSVGRKRYEERLKEIERIIMDELTYHKVFRSIPKGLRTQHQVRRVFVEAGAERNRLIDEISRLGKQVGVSAKERNLLVKRLKSLGNH